MHKSEGELAGRVRDQHRKNAGVLVVHAIESNAMIGTKCRKPESAPVEQIVGDGDFDSRATARKRGVGHNVALQRLDIRDARILASAPCSDSS